MVSYSLPWLTKVAGAAVEFDLVEFFATGLALAAAFAFFGGMLSFYCADVRCSVECESKVVAWSQQIYLDVASCGELRAQVPSSDVGVAGKERSALFST